MSQPGIDPLTFGTGQILELLLTLVDTVRHFFKAFLCISLGCNDLHRIRCVLVAAVSEYK